MNGVEAFSESKGLQERSKGPQLISTKLPKNPFKWNRYFHFKSIASCKSKLLESGARWVNGFNRNGSRVMVRPRPKYQKASTGSLSQSRPNARWLSSPLCLL